MSEDELLEQKLALEEDKDIYEKVIDDEDWYYSDEFMNKQAEWMIIDDLVAIAQKQYKEEATEKDKEESQKALCQLFEKFQPFFRKYMIVIKTGQINFNNPEQKLFAALFMESSALKSALYSAKPVKKELRIAILQAFNFIKETYGHNEESDILTDLYMLFMTLVKRYKPMDRSFACYVYNCFRYEVARHIYSFTKNPLNIHYRNLSFEALNEYDPLELSDLDVAEDFNIEDKIYVNEMDLPNLTWIQGINCSDVFSKLSPLHRKILVKYYLEYYTDKQLADEYGLHLNTCNGKRHQAINIIAKELGIDKSEIKRSRNSGLKKI